MTARQSLMPLILALACLAAWQGFAQNAPFENADQASDALRQATRALADAQKRGDQLEQAARRATAAADRTASDRRIHGPRHGCIDEPIG